jgi:Right handed beta helix region
VISHKERLSISDMAFRGCNGFALLTSAWMALTTSSGAATYQVGPTRTYHTVGALPALTAGDVVEVDPATYNEVKRWTVSGTAAKPIVIRGVGGARPVFDATNQVVDGVLPHPRAVFQVEANYITLENLEFRNARNGDNGAGIRVTSGNNATVRNCRITFCDMGIMSDNNSNLVIEASEIASNGTSLYDGFSHNFYLGGNSATVRFCYIHDSLYGQNFKTRAHYTELLYNYIADSQDGEVGLVDAAETAATNSHAVMIGNIVISKPRLSGYNSGRFIQFGQDSGGQHNGTLFAFNNTFIAGDGRIQFLSANMTNATIIAANNIFYGSGQLVGTVGGGVSGTNNWAQSSATIPASFSATTTGTDPAFVNRAARDLRLTKNSPCRNLWLNVLNYLDGAGASHSGVPMFEYVNHQQNRARANDGQLDLGAYEYSQPIINYLRLSGGNALVSFNAQSGNQYDLQYASNVLGGAWVPVTTNIPGSNGVIEITDTNGAGFPRRFYRIKSAL